MAAYGKLLAACCVILLPLPLPGQDMNQIRIIPYFEDSRENAIDTAGNILFEDRWDFLIRIEACNCFLGIHFLEQGDVNVNSTYDGLPADYALLYPDGSSETLQYREIGELQDNKLAVQQEQWGVVDCQGRWILEPCLDFPPRLHHDFILFRIDSLIRGPLNSHRGQLFGVMDYAGEMLLPAVYTEIEILDWWSETYFIVTDIHGRDGLVNARGEMILFPDSVRIFPSLRDESVWILSDQEPWVYYPGGNQWIRDDTQELTRGVFGLEGGLNLVPWQGDWETTQWVSTDHQLRIDAGTDNIRRLFHHPWMKFEKSMPDGSTACGIIGRNGRILLPAVYEDIYEMHENDLLYPASTQCVFEGTASVRLNGHWGLTDTSGTLLTHVHYDDMQGLSEGIVAVEVDGRTGFIDREGNKVVPCIFDFTTGRWENGIGIAHVIESPVCLNRFGRIIWKSWNEGDDPYFREHMKEEKFTLIDRYRDYAENELGVSYDDLKAVDLAGEGLISLPDFLTELRQLEEIALAGNHIREIHFDLASWPRLTSIDLSSNDLRGLPVSIGKLKRLEKLDLSNNRLSKLPDEIMRCKHLHTIDLRNNLLQRLPDGLLEMKNLRVLELKGNPLADDVYEQIRAQRPDLMAE